MTRILLLISGMFVTALGLFFIVLYLNLFTIGYSFIEFVKFIISNVYCDLFFLGIMLIIISLKGMKLK